MAAYTYLGQDACDQALAHHPQVQPALVLAHLEAVLAGQLDVRHGDHPVFGSAFGLLLQRVAPPKTRRLCRCTVRSGRCGSPRGGFRERLLPALGSGSASRRTQVGQQPGDPRAAAHAATRLEWVDACVGWAWRGKGAKERGEAGSVPMPTAPDWTGSRPVTPRMELPGSASTATLEPTPPSMLSVSAGVQGVLKKCSDELFLR